MVLCADSDSTGVFERYDLCSKIDELNRVKDFTRLLDHLNTGLQEWTAGLMYYSGHGLLDCSASMSF